MTKRGQTTLDFAIGMSVFLAVLVFIFLFIPGLLTPFTEGAQEETVTSNRVADQLSKSMLGTPNRPYTLDTHCTLKFFENTSDAPDRCNDDWDPVPIEEQMGFEPDQQGLNVTIQGNVTSGQPDDEILCWDSNNEELVQASNGADCDIPLTRGDPIPTDNDQTVAALRVVALHGQDVTIYVEMW